MNSKNLVRIGVFGALLLVCGLCILTAYGFVDWIRRVGSPFNAIAFGDQFAQVTETRTFDMNPLLKIVSDAGSIEVTAADVTQIEVQMVKTAWAETVEEAEVIAEAMSIQVSEGADTLTLTYDKPDEFGFGGPAGPDSISFTVRVPAETAVDLSTFSGKVDISGLVGDAKIESDFGSIDVENLTGALEATSSNATISVKEVEAEGGKVNVKTSFGSITIENVFASEITLETNNGHITARTLTAENQIEIKDQFGSVEIYETSAPTFLVDNQNGRITFENGEVAGLLSLSTSFGGIQVTDVEASEYQLTTSNGRITVEGSMGNLNLKNSFGDINITDALNATLNIECTNGTIEFTGVLNPDTFQSVSTSFGAIRLTIPEVSSFNVTLDTSFGQIESEIPVSLTGSLGSPSEDNHLEGILNSGGPELKATTSNGDITISILPSE